MCILVIVCRIYWCSTAGVTVRKISNRKIQLKNFSLVRGVKVEFPDNIHGLHSIERFSGLQYGTIRGVQGNMLRYMPSSSNIPTSPDVKDCVAFEPVCPQDEAKFLSRLSGGYAKRFMRITESLKGQKEDCLYLNIWAPVPGEKYFNFCFRSVTNTT